MRTRPGTAIKRPNAVVIKACEMPAAKRSGLAPEDSVKPVNAVIMPTSVPRRPSNGLTVAIVPRRDKYCSIWTS